MFSFRWRTSGSRRVANKMRGAAAAAPRATQDAAYKWGQNVRAALRAKPYPPERTGQTYRRTYKLQRSFYARRVGKSSIEIGNSQPYSNYVIGDKSGGSQAWMHQGRWWLVRDVIQAETPALRQDILKALDREFKS